MGILIGRSLVDCACRARESLANEYTEAYSQYIVPPLLARKEVHGMRAHAAPSSLIVILSLTVMLLSSTSPCIAQQGPQWVHFDEYPEGTPASFELM